MRLLPTILLIGCVLAVYLPSGESVNKDDVLKYLNTIWGTNIITGQHNRNPNSDPTRWTNVVQNITGKLPGLWSADLLYTHEDVQDRHIMLDEAIRQWNDGSLVSLMWHACPPTQGESCEWEGGVSSRMDDSQWKSLMTDGDPVNIMWKRRLDTLVPIFQKLEEAGVVVIFRPFHAINPYQGFRRFWWDGRMGEDGSARLFQITHEYLAPKVGNVIWAWSIMENGWMYGAHDYFPGRDYIDLAILDSDGEPTEENYMKIQDIAEGKPVALGAVKSIPTPELLEYQSKWLWFMVYAEYLKDPEYNTDERIRETYDWSKALNQGQLNIS